MIESMPKQSEDWLIAQQHFMDGYNTARKELEHLGWHPASELPPEEGEYIAIDNGMPDVFRVDYLEPFGWCVEVMGAHEVVNVKWWCYPPKED